MFENRFVRRNFVLNFNTVKWQDSLVSDLRQSISYGTLGHAILFCGERQTCLCLAHAVSDAILCDSKENGQACMRCPSCAKTNAGSHPDKIVVSATKETIGVNEIREFIKKVETVPFISDYKVCIFEDASKLTVQAQNALLKVTEQPPEYCTIIMVSDKEEDLLPTVLSRFKKYKLRIPTGKEVGSYLAKKYPEKKELALFCGNFCEGSITGAEDLLLKGGDYAMRRKLYLFFDRVFSAEKSAVFDFADYLFDNKDDFGANILYIQTIVRDMLCIKNGFKKEFAINSDLWEELTSLSEKFSSDFLENFISGITECYNNVSVKRASLKLNVLNFLINIREELYDRNSRSKI